MKNNTMKKLFILTTVMVFFASCQNITEKRTVQRLIDNEYPSANLKVVSIKDTVGYSITPLLITMDYLAAKGDFDGYREMMDVCSEQTNDWTVDHGGVPRRLLIAHCRGEWHETDIEVFNEVKNGQSVRYYLATDEMVDFVKNMQKHH